MTTNDRWLVSQLILVLVFAFSLGPYFLDDED